MKKFIYLLVLLAALGLAGCQNESVTETTAVPPEDTTTTLMVYMVGSDLEAKAGSATRDLQEMAGSGIDLTKVNVLVYAGGSAFWHNDTASPECHTLLHLTEDGFTALGTVENSSMGEAPCLSGFLNYGYTNFPADEYALILWDHGDGPVIGYGRDMLFGDDCLTLLEMEQALQASPFGENEKLSWVGFDACLMASAELSCVWAPYADYLAASQEVEPSFGWDYSFLSGLGSRDTPALLETAATSYLATCREYYTSRGYENRDTTLSCVDLSCAGDLEAAINALFSKATRDIGKSYNLLTAKRVQTRALGRATTGSEYDLIDLLDMASQLLDTYPEEAAALEAVLQDMVVVNAVNTDGCCGMSLYYPFYNKDYYEMSWGEAYAALGLFPDYQNYLQAYETVWLQNDMLEDFAVSTTPSVTPGGYTLQLTDEQAEHFASARYYILQRTGTDMYTTLFSSQDVDKANTLLTANFDGNILYAQDNYGNWFIPVAQEHDTVGDLTRYSVFVQLSNACDTLLPAEDSPELVTEPNRFHLALNKKTGKVSVSALLPSLEALDTETFLSGKAEDADLSRWTAYVFPLQQHRYLTRYENGAVCPVDSWPDSGWISYNRMPIGDGLNFVYAPLDAGEYYLVFEIEDTQGSRYCSELLPIHTDTSAPQRQALTTQLQWLDGERILLAEQNDIAVYLKMGEKWNRPAYFLEMENRSDSTVVLRASNLVCNGSIFCPDGYVSLLVAGPGETVTDTNCIVFGNAGALGALEDLQSLSFCLTVSDGLTLTTLLPRQTVCVTLSEETSLSQSRKTAIAEPYLDAFAQEQVLYTSDTARISLLACGEDPIYNTLTGYLCIENLSDEPIDANPQGICLNGLYIGISGPPGEIPAGCRVYTDFLVPEEALANCGITSIASMALLLEFTENANLVGGFSTPVWCRVALSQSGADSGKLPEGTLLMDENGIRIEAIQQADHYGSPNWFLAVTNSSDADIQLELADILINGQTPEKEYSPGVVMMDNRVGAQMGCISRIACQLEVPITLTFRIRVLDYAGETILYTSDQTITLEFGKI